MARQVHLIPVAVFFIVGSNIYQ